MQCVLSIIHLTSQSRKSLKFEDYCVSGPPGTLPILANISESANLTLKPVTIDELHHRMGHIDHDDLFEMVRKDMIEGIDIDLNSKPSFCEICVQAKATCKSFPKKSENNASYKAYGEKVTADLWGLAEVERRNIFSSSRTCFCA